VAGGKHGREWGRAMGHEPVKRTAQAGHNQKMAAVTPDQRCTPVWHGWWSGVKGEYFPDRKQRWRSDENVR